MISRVALHLPSPAPSLLTKLAEVMHLAYADAPSWLVAAQFRFDEGYLQVEVDPADDTVEVSFDPRQRPALHHWVPDSVPTEANGRSRLRSSVRAGGTTVS